MESKLTFRVVILIGLMGCSPRSTNTTGAFNESTHQRVGTEKAESRRNEDFGTETTRITKEGLPLASHNPDEGEQRRLRVEWGESIVTGDEKSLLVEIRGRIFLVSSDGKAQKPIEWVQPVRVLLGRRAKHRPDWSKHHDRTDTIWNNTAAAPDSAGSFTAKFSLTEVNRQIEKADSYQVGLCLGVKEGKSFIYVNTMPVLPQSVSTIVIHGRERLSETLRLITACPSPIGWDYDPISLVRASNHLRSLGKPKAIAAMREFLQLARDPGYGPFTRSDPENIDQSNQWCLESLVPLVFEAADPGGKGPPLRGTYVTLWEGIPFHNVVIKATSGWPPSTAPLVDWAEKYGKIIDKPLRPTDKALEAADSLFRKLAGGPDHDATSPSPDLCGHLRLQAWRAIRHLIEPDRTQDRGKHAAAFESEENWIHLKTTARALNIHWNETRQEYTAERP